MFNELEVDELCFLDIRATVENRQPNMEILSEIADECFMPLSYGGGVKDAEIARKILAIGFEKIVLNTAAIMNPNLVSRIADNSGSQSVIVSIDVRKNMWGKYHVYSHDGTKKTELDPVEWAQQMEKTGAGELLVTSMNQDGTWQGFDLDITGRIVQSVSIPVIANGGAGSLEHIRQVVKHSGASAVALGSMVVYQKKGMGVLVNFPDHTSLLKHIQ
jgi:cyclase